MVNLTKQRRLAAKILHVGLGRVWIDPKAAGDVAEAITRNDIRGLIEDGVIQKIQKQGISSGRARVNARQKAMGRRKGHGSRKGARGARTKRKERWMSKIRALRYRLKELRADDSINKTVYRKLYNKANGGDFRNVAHLNDYITAHELLGQEET
ncbi:MAG: 50S ribosomal protein L19e [Methanomicrobia archaeon]|nr:50S ribosomal protein L19e [Methanomicrobia archaeon]